MACRRGTSNTNSRGSSYMRRSRRAFLIRKFGSKSGLTIPCFWCGRRMRTSCGPHGLGVFEVDRYPVCGHDGGTYRRENIVPSCKDCNGRRCKGGSVCRTSDPVIAPPSAVAARAEEVRHELGIA